MKQDCPIPIIDVSSLYRHDMAASDLPNAQQRETAMKIDQALVQFGVFIVSGHEFDSRGEEQHSPTALSMKAAKELFDLPLAVKTACAMQNLGRGYLGFGAESGVASYFEPKEGYSYGNPLFASNLPLETPNIWPEGLTDVAIDEMNNVFLRNARLAKALVRGLQIANDENELMQEIGNPRINYVEASEHGEKISLMRLFHYFSASTAVCRSDQKEERPQEQRQLGSSPHTDWGFLTLILHDGTPGLQFLYNDHWVDVPYVPHGIIVNGGDYLRLLSKNRYKSPIHRVICPPTGQERTSFVMFFYPGRNTVMPLPFVTPSTDSESSTSSTLQSSPVHSKTCENYPVSDNGSDERKSNNAVVESGEAKAITTEYNTLLRIDSSQLDRLMKSNNSNDSILFGDFIQAKWKEVFRSHHKY